MSGIAQWTLNCIVVTALSVKFCIDLTRVGTGIVTCYCSLNMMRSIVISCLVATKILVIKIIDIFLLLIPTFAMSNKAAACHTPKVLKPQFLTCCEASIYHSHDTVILACITEGKVLDFTRLPGKEEEAQSQKTFQNRKYQTFVANRL